MQGLMMLIALLAVTPGARTVTVLGTGEVEVKPERATVSVAVETEGRTADAAATDAGKRIDAVTKALRKLGVPEDAIRTTQYEVQPDYQPQERPELPPRLAGYRALQVLEVRVASLQRLGAVIDGAIAAGANRVMDLRLEAADPRAARRDALRKAVADARAEAEAVATAAGEKLGAPLSLSTMGEPSMPMPVDLRMAEMKATTVPAGPLTVTATVQAVYGLAEGR
jgi:uncharacterized protein YggE